MPQWGLTKELRETEPWGIPEAWLKPSKIVTDPVHGDIYLSKLECALVDSPPFQRLRRIRQLGTVHLVYPGATHTRFSHALGSLRVVQDLLDIILEQRNGREPEYDLFAQWELEHVKEPRKFERKIAETVVFARLGTLLHDVCHVAYGHTIEDDLEVLEPHDANRARFAKFWRGLARPGGKHSAELARILDESGLKDVLRVVVLSKLFDEPADELRKLGKYPFVADLVTNTICADLLDYLPRDHAFTGLPVGLGQRFMTAFYVVPKQADDEERFYPERMALRISHHGRERQDISSELLKHLRFRYELQERVIVHHAKLAADAMLGKALAFWREHLWLERAETLGGAELKRASAEGGDQPLLKAALLRDVGKKSAGKVDRDVSKKLERRLQELGDDGLLEYLAGRFAKPGSAVDPRSQALAKDLLNRRLYKRAAQATGRCDRELVFTRHGREVEKRRELERKAAAYVGASEEQVIIWVPDPKMRMKTAEVLVDYGAGIAPFKKVSDRGEEIYRDHEELWTITVFVHKDLRRKGHEPAILARLAELMGVEWDMHKPPGAKRPADWPLARALAEIAVPHQDEAGGGPPPLTEEDVEVLLKGPDAHHVVQRGKALTFTDQKNAAKRLVAKHLKDGDSAES